jgi:hypothetical protein
MRFIILVILINFSFFLIAWRVDNFVFQTPPPNLTTIKHPGFWFLKPGIHINGVVLRIRNTFIVNLFGSKQFARKLLKTRCAL